MTKVFVAVLLSTTLLAQGTTAPSAPPRQPARKSANQSGAADVDAVIALIKGGMPEERVIKTIRSARKPYQLTPSTLLKLQQAGISERVVDAMENPGGASADNAGTQTVPPSETRLLHSTPYPPDLSNVPQANRKRHVAVLPFDYSAVTTWVHYWFHNDVNIGQGIRAMLTARMGQAKNVVLLERARLDAIQSELNLNNKGNTVNQVTKVKMGKVSGADCILMGDITIFGRDDKSERSHENSLNRVGVILGRRLPGHPALDQIGTFSKEEKAVVAFALRIVDTETAEVLETAEAKGESSRSSKSWASFTSDGGAYQSNSGAMESSNFQATIIGEATSAAVDKVIALLDERVPRMPLRPRVIEGRVAKVSSNNPILGFGSNEGVAQGDRFEVLRIVSEVIDPATRQVLDVETTKAGELVVTTVRDQIATGNYGGEPLSENYQKGYTARLMVR